MLVILFYLICEESELTFLAVERRSLVDHLWMDFYLERNLTCSYNLHKNEIQLGVDFIKAFKPAFLCRPKNLKNAWQSTVIALK